MPVQPPLDYVVVAGNSGAGKSTMLRALRDALVARGRRVDMADERELHHPLLARQFVDPATWALPMQIEFPAQRIIRILQSAAGGAAAGDSALLLMERCVWEDSLFFDYYVQRGAIPASSRAGYLGVHQALAAKSPRPRLIVYLAADVDTACARLEQAVRRGERPHEWVGEELRAYIAAVQELYDSWSETASGLCDAFVRVATDAPGFSPEAEARRLASLLLDGAGS